MAIITIDGFYKGEDNLDQLIVNEQYMQLGFYGVMFSNMTNDLLPVILDGSIVEVNGDLYEFDGNESISGTPSTGVCYVKCYLSGSNLVAEFTNTDPVYNPVKVGWYGESSYADHRYILRLEYNGSAYYRKQIIHKERYWYYEI